jgi:hypothetical protein
MEAYQSSAVTDLASKTAKPSSVKARCKAYGFYAIAKPAPPARPPVLSACSPFAPM